MIHSNMILRLIQVPVYEVESLKHILPSLPFKSCHVLKLYSLRFLYPGICMYKYSLTFLCLQLRKSFPNIRLSLPPKRWFRDNFDKNFIEDRQLGLQAFVDNCVGHKDICNRSVLFDLMSFSRSHIF